MVKEVILIDGANVAWEAPSSSRKPRVSNIIAVKQAVEELGFAPIIIVDASLKHHVDDPEQLEGLFNSAQVLQAPSGTVADYFVLRTADERGAQIVSNDEFEQYRSEFAWIKRRRVPFMIVSGSVHLYRPKLDLPTAPEMPAEAAAATVAEIAADLAADVAADAEPMTAPDAISAAQEAPAAAH
jgi:hypothetical protein